jgi:hypothetical protein
MNDYLYSLVRQGTVLVSLNVIDTAREGLEYFGGTTYIRFNQPGITNYEEAKRFEETHYGTSKDYHDA